MIGLVWLEPPRREQARAPLIGIGGERRAHCFGDRGGVQVIVYGAIFDVTADMHMGPAPERLFLRKEGHVRDLDQRQLRLWRLAVRISKLTNGQHGQSDPGCEAPVLLEGRFRSESPGEVLVIKFDEWQVIGLEVGDQGLGLGADDRARFKADEIARTVERNLARSLAFGLLAAFELLAGKLDFNLDRRSRARRAGNLRGEFLAEARAGNCRFRSGRSCRKLPACDYMQVHALNCFKRIQMIMGLGFGLECRGAAVGQIVVAVGDDEAVLRNFHLVGEWLAQRLLALRYARKGDGASAQEEVEQM